MKSDKCADCDYFTLLLDDGTGCCEFLEHVYGLGDDWTQGDNEACDNFKKERQNESLH